MSDGRIMIKISSQKMVHCGNLGKTGVMITYRGSVTDFWRLFELLNSFDICLTKVDVGPLVVE